MKYDDIINREYHGSIRKKRMPIADRAAQFMPFKALVGHEDLINETARYVDSDIELLDDEKYIISEKINALLEDVSMVAIFKVFIKDKYKSGGMNYKYEGSIIKYDEYNKTIRLDDDTLINIENIRGIEIKNEI